MLRSEGNAKSEAAEPEVVVLKPARDYAWSLKVAAHVHGDAAGKIAIKAAVDSIERGSFLRPDTLAMMKAKGIFLVPTLLAGETVGTQVANSRRRSPPKPEPPTRRVPRCSETL